MRPGPSVSIPYLLRRGKKREARTLAHSIYEAGLGAMALADQLVRPVMERVGRSWMVGAIDNYQEHQATHLLASCLIELIDRVPREQEGPAPLALGAASEGDFFVLPGLLGELVLRESDWDVRNQGVNLPLRSLANAVLEYRPWLVFLTLSHFVDEERFMRESLSFHENAVARGVTVIVGGTGAPPRSPRRADLHQRGRSDGAPLRVRATAASRGPHNIRVRARSQRFNSLLTSPKLNFSTHSSPSFA